MAKCGGCGCKEGELHAEGCEHEECPTCGGQLMGCECPDPAQGERRPFILWPIVCARCGALWPEQFMVSAQEWRQVVGLERQRVTLCRPCYDAIRAMVQAQGDAQPVARL